MFGRGSLVALVLLAGCQDKKAEPKVTLHPQKPSSLVAVPDAAAAPRTLVEELEQIRSEHKLPAIAAAVWRDGKLVELDAVGVRKVDDPASKVTKADLWHIGSNTKAMTATLVGIFVDRGTLKWTDTIATLFKGVKIDPGYAKVTLDQLIRHEGGAPGEPPPELWKQLWDDGAKPDARAKFVAGILARPPAQPAGTFTYSNAGYMIAGAALERATKKTWEQLMRDELFAKLDMKSCGFGPPGTRATPANSGTVDQPWGHDAGGSPIAPGPAADNPPGVGPAGTVHCSLEDYGKFLALHATGKPELVSAEAMQHLHAVRGMGYAGGWIVMAPPPPGTTTLAHSGSNTMWYLTAMVALAPKPEDRYAFVMATNSGSDAIESVFERLVKRHGGSSKK
jgi:D-alanyl-D-alanine carboxypeptidase